MTIPKALMAKHRRDVANVTFAARMKSYTAQVKTYRVQFNGLKPTKKAEPMEYWVNFYGAEKLRKAKLIPA